MSTWLNALELENQTSFYSEDPWVLVQHLTWPLWRSLLLFFWCHHSPRLRMHPNPCCPGPVSSQSSSMRNSVTLIRSRKQSVQSSFSMGNRILSFLTHIVKTCTHYAQWRATSTCQRRWIIMSFSLMRILSNHLGNSYRSYRNSTRIIISRKAKANHQKAPKKKPLFSKRV